ncbi:translation initiation factor eIF1 [Gonapodya prolifera JEL478]|uniref:Translation initiation factor eIF1 n=1 Tax=Gonapodya prolifera (strain JEL478) TaxID=1344416 RepID=A0A139A3J2_GONPJ|nr:translation initiation factor eIF1 [Gonapodya prolifera JEL478]|eukprot:KXS11284.1 translation initiation factor eIF1 [Gonapodya prolifera JEL478]
MSIENLKAYDPFADVGEVDDIRIQQRNGRKSLTTIAGLPPELDQKKLLKAFKKEFACNGSLVQDEDHGEVIQLQGDQRLKVQQFLATEGIASKDQVQVHGF